MHAIKKNLWTAISIGSLVLIDQTLAQETSAAYTYETRYFCKSGQEPTADEIIARIEAPIYDQDVDTGELFSWGWFKHISGDTSRRLFIEIGPSPQSLYDGQIKAGRAFAANPEDVDRFRQICHSHTDHIWRTIEGVLDGTSDTLITVSFSCDLDAARSADKVLAEKLAPLLNALQEEGALEGWAWRQNLIGQGANRSLGLQGPNYADLLLTWEETERQMEAAFKREKTRCAPGARELWRR
ncbi:MAG: hypothetical protein AAFR21_15120 [Pseudomonadota bacterium]